MKVTKIEIRYTVQNDDGSTEEQSTTIDTSTKGEIERFMFQHTREVIHDELRLHPGDMVELSLQVRYRTKDKPRNSIGATTMADLKSSEG